MGLISQALGLPRKRKHLLRCEKLLGKSDYRAYAGAYSGGANAVYWLELLQHNADGTVKVRNISEGAKREIQAVHMRLSQTCCNPLLRGREVGKWITQSDQDARFSHGSR